MIRGSGCSKSRLAKAAGAEVAVQQRNEKWHAAVARSTFSSQNAQNTTSPDPFLKLRCRKMHAALARSTFASQNVQNTSASEQFLKFRCRKIARRCGREAHLQVKMHKTPHVRTTFWSSDVQKVTRLTTFEARVKNRHAAVARITVNQVKM